MTQYESNFRHPAKFRDVDVDIFSLRKESCLRISFTSGDLFIYLCQSVLNPTCVKARTAKLFHAKFNQLVPPFLRHLRCVFTSSQTILVFLTLVETVEIALETLV